MSYSFVTERLAACEWHVAEHRGEVADLPAVVAAMMTEPVTRWLPPSWQGPYTRARAAAWIAERDAEGSVLLVLERETRSPIGLVLLFEELVDDGIEARLGYLLAEEAWGQGFGSELLRGVVAWCRGRPEVRSVVGGVARDNVASIRLLERHGFVREAATEAEAQLSYRLRLPS